MSRLVVIADADLERAERLREACAVRGYATHICPTRRGRARDRARAKCPTCSITADPLELIDAARLAEILRANPRTRRVRFVFVGEAPAGGAEEWGALTVAADADPDEVGERVADAGRARLRAASACVQEAREVVEGVSRRSRSSTCSSSST